MTSYLSKTPGIGGLLKSSPEDFLVEEIGMDGRIFELNMPIELEKRETLRTQNSDGKYIHFILQKKNWTTSSAISEIATRLGISHKHFNVAGNKDKVAITTQLASVSGTNRDELLGLNIKDISINGSRVAKDRVRIGQLLGNRFTITPRNSQFTQESDPSGSIEQIYSELNGKFPNYFGGQRFGSSRRNTHIIGHKLLLGELEEAILMFLCKSGSEKDPEVVAARRELSDTLDFTRALKYYPKHLRLERSIISTLANNSNDPDRYLRALRFLPRNILLLFIHAFQSYLFNILLSERLAQGELELEIGEYFCAESLGFPDIKKTSSEGWICAKLIGYTSPLNKRERELMDSLKMDKECFRMKKIPEIASKGSYRTLLAPIKDFNYHSNIFRFALPSGSYATVVMGEFIDPKNEKTIHRTGLDLD